MSILVPDKSFVVPRGTNRLVAQAKAKVAAQQGLDVELDIPDLVDLPWTPDRWLMVVSPVAKSKIGSIELTEESRDGQQWISGVGRVIAVGPALYKGPQFANKGLKPEDAPKPGDFVIYNARTPLRFKYQGRVYITLNDDATLGRVHPDKVKDALANINFNDTY